MTGLKIISLNSPEGQECMDGARKNIKEAVDKVYKNTVFKIDGSVKSEAMTKSLMESMMPSNPFEGDVFKSPDGVLYIYGYGKWWDTREPEPVFNIQMSDEKKS